MLHCNPQHSTDAISWVSHHTGKHRDTSDQIKTIVGRLPLIDHYSNDIDLQAHLMKIAMDYTLYLNLHQGRAIGCSDQPLYAWKKKTPMGFSRCIFKVCLFFYSWWVAY